MSVPRTVPRPFLGRPTGSGLLRRAEILGLVAHDARVGILEHVHGSAVTVRLRWRATSVIGCPDSGDGSRVGSATPGHLGLWLVDMRLNKDAFASQGQLSERYH